MQQRKKIMVKPRQLTNCPADKWMSHRACAKVGKAPLTWLHTWPTAAINAGAMTFP